MQKYAELSQEQLENEFELVKARYDEFCLRDLSLNMARGNPSVKQMDLSEEAFSKVGPQCGYLNESGIDCRNYGGLDGLPELKVLFADMMDVEPSQVIVGGNS